jgi:hypothetical protein
MRATTTQLERYLNSWGVDFPRDYLTFRPGGQNEDLCVFCSKPHEHNKVYAFNPLDADDDNPTNLHVNCCDECSSQVDNLIAEKYKVFWKELHPDWKSPIQAENDELDKTHRINQFMMTDSFSYDVHKFYLHLDVMFDDYVVKGHPNVCYFCRGASRTYGEQMKYVYNAVTLDRNVTGGKVVICKNCALDVYKLHQDNTLASKCRKCGEDYRITHEEYEERLRVGTQDKHNCPKCVSKELNSLDDLDTLLYSPKNLIPRRDVPERFIANECDFCHEGFMVDITVNHDILRQIHTGQENKCRCNVCYIFGMTKANGNKFLFKYDSNVFIIIHKEKRWIYRISKIKSFKEVVILKGPAEGFDRVSECIATAFNYCKTRTEQGSPLELWEET